MGEGQEIDRAVRIAREADAGAIRAIYEPFVRASHVSFELEAPSDEEIRTRMRAALASAPWLVYETGGEVVGYAYATRFRDRPAYRWSVEVSVYVREDRRRRGVARALLTEILESLQRQGFRNAFAVIALPNPASVALFEALGFRPAGVWRDAGYKLDRWWDVGIWQRALGDGSAPVPPAGA